MISRLRRVLPEPVKRPLRMVVHAVRRGRAAVADWLDRVVPKRPDPEVDGVSVPILERQRTSQREQRHFGRGELANLERLLGRADLVVPLREAFARRNDHPERFVAMRHDLDHDVENAVRMARWEADHGWRATYFVEHTDWYWGRRGGREPSAYVLRALDEIAGLGHEIGIHNNAIAEALRTGRQPVEVLTEALEGLRGHGFEITGTAAHGDPLARRLGFVNNELFSGCGNPDGAAPDRTISHRDPRTGRTTSVTLRPVDMAELGLEYEAYGIGHTRYLSDAEGRWNQSPDELEAEFVREGAYLQILTHPVHWAFEGEVVRPIPVRARPPAAGIDPMARDLSVPPFPILVRGDCCSRRAILMNTDLFGGNPEMVRDEKSRSDFFLDHLVVGSPTEEDVRRYIDVDRLPGSHRDYAVTQTTRDTLADTDARLIVMDSYADMNFTAWRHRERGWKLWIYADFLRDREAFERDFERAGYLSLDEAVDASVALIERYRSQVGPVPVLYLHQPTAFYKKLDHRLEFRGLGPAIAERLPDVFVGDVDDSELEPDDMGSSGPGQTLHFTGPSYRKMIQVALDRGLAARLR